MSKEESDFWTKINESGKAKRNSNILKSREILIRSKIDFQEKTNWHFIVWDYDFWATTGLFIHRKTKARSRWVFGLVAKIKPVWNTKLHLN